MASSRDIRKYFRYITDSRPFSFESAEEPSPEAVETAAHIRGNGRKPAVFIHGVLPRSGTVYVGELMRNHPELHAFPRELWELPFLERTDDIRQMQEEFLWSYVQNKDKIGGSDFLPLFGASLLAYLHESTPRTKRILLKVSGAQYLHRFYDVFPHEALLLLIRDGRDVVHSTINTWPQFRFWMACLRWKRASEMSFYVQNKFKHEGRLFWCGRFEAAIQDPHEFVKQACEQLELDDSVYPWESIGNQPVMGSSSLNRRGNVRWEPVEKPEGFHPIGHWRQWSAYRRIVFKVIAGEMLTKLGYGLEDEW